MTDAANGGCDAFGAEVGTVRTALGFKVRRTEKHVSALSHYLSHGRIPEPFEMHIARAILSNISGAFLDIGANSGIYCHWAAQLLYPGSIFAYEPQSSAFEVLRDTAELNGSKVECIQCALGSHSDHAPLWLSDSGSTLHQEFKGAATVTEMVEVRTLDSEARRLKINPSFLKIDVEGHELDVLLGGEAIIARDHPVIMIEIWDKDPRRSQVLDWFRWHSYIVRRMSESCRLLLPSQGQGINYIALPNQTWLRIVTCAAEEFHRQNLPFALSFRLLKRFRPLLGLVPRPILDLGRRLVWPSP